MKERNLNIFFILDGSGSMGSVQSDVIGGLNSFIDEQKQEKSKTRFWLTVFDDKIVKVHEGVDVADVSHVDQSTTLLGGSTALLDAIGKTLAEAENAKGAQKRENLVVVYTDGHENTSKEFKKDEIKALREKFEGKGNWTFTFMGANMDAFGEASKYGFAQTNTMAGTLDHTKNFAVLSSATHSHRSSASSGSDASFYAGDLGGSEDPDKIAKLFKTKDKAGVA